MYFEDFTTGQMWAGEPVTLSAEQIIAFAERYDPMPFHTDAAFAQSTRFGGLIASGHQTFLANWTAFAEANPDFISQIVAGQQITMRWLTPVYADDVLSAHLEVIGTEGRNAYNGCVSFSFEAHNQRDACVMTADIEIIFSRRPPSDTDCVRSPGCA